MDAAGDNARLRLCLLGTFEAALDSAPLTGFRSDKVRALLAFLAIEANRPHRREALATLLWGDFPERAARRSLSQALTNLRQLLAPLEATRGEGTCLSISRHAVEFQPGPEIWLDVDAFDILLTAKDGKPAEEEKQRSAGRPPSTASASIASLTQAAELYRGPFLAGLTLADCPGFEEWRLLQGEERHQAVLLGLEALTNHHLAGEDAHQAQVYARRQLALEPWRESAHRQLMLALALDGQRGAALQQYGICIRQLAEELGIEAEPETIALREQIWRGELAALARPRAGGGPASEHPLPPSPYRGLFPFRQQDAGWFFGRDTFVRRLVDAVHEKAVVAVIGPSGSGKSSAVFAGLLPRLRQVPLPPLPRGQGAPPSSRAGGHDPERFASWHIAVLRPGARPIESLATALIPLLEPESSSEEHFAQAAELARALHLGQTTLCRAMRPVLEQGASTGSGPRAGRSRTGRPDPGRLLLVVDQFEELYTLCPDTAIRQVFLQLLLGDLSGGPAPPCTLLLTLRADYMGQVLTHRPLADGLEDGSLIMGPMSSEEAARAVEQPALAQGVSFEPGLVERIVHDVGAEPGNLPLLQFALTALWQRQASVPSPRRRGAQLSHTAYDATGRVQGALANYAEDIYGRFEAADQVAARRILVQMVRPGHHARDTRRLITRAELADEDWMMVQQLAGARLIVTGRDPAGLETAELVHEALIDGWDRLDGWLNEDRAFRIWRERLREALRSWIASGRDKDTLLRGSPLAEAEGWYTAYGPDLPPRLREYIEAGLALQEQQRLAAQDQRQRELDHAQALAQAERRRADEQARASRRLRWLATGLTAVFVIALVAAGLAIQLRQEAQRQAGVAVAAQAEAEAAYSASEQDALRAEEQARIAETERIRAEEQARLALSQQLAAQSVTLLDKQLDLALLLNLEARRLAEPGPERGAYLSSLTYGPFLVRFLHGHDDPILELGRSPDGRTVTSVNSQGGALVWDLQSGQHVHRLPPQETEVAGAVSADGRVVAVAAPSAGGSWDILLWDAAEGQVLGPYLRAHAAPIHNLALNGNGSVLVSGDAGGEIRVWDVLPTGGQSRAGGQPRTLAQPLTYDGSGIMVLRPDGERLAIAAKGSTLDVHDLRTGELLARNESVHPGYALHNLVYSPDGRVLVTASFDKTLILWDAETVEALGPPLEGHDGRVLASTFSPDGRTLASASTDNTVRLWDISPLLAPEGVDSGAQPTPQLALAQAGAQAGAQPLRGHSNWVRSVTFLPDGHSLVSGDSDGKTIVWDTGRARQLAGHQAQVRGVAFSPDGRTLVSGGLDTDIMLWGTATGERALPPLTDHPKPVYNLAYSPSGRHMASVGAGRWVILWELPEGLSEGEESEAPVGHPLDGHTGQVYCAAFSPDGRTLATGSRDREIILWDVEKAEALGPSLEAHEGWVLGLAFSPDGRALASASADGTVRIWAVGGLLDGTEESAHPLGPPLVGHSNWVNDVAFSPDGTLLATASSDNTVRLWDPLACVEPGAVTCEPLGPPLTGHAAQVWSVDFLPGGDGQYLVSGGADGTVLVWDLATREPLAPPLLGSVEMETMAISPDGNTVALGALDTSGLVHLWDLDLTPWEARACAIANRNLTDSEWRRYLGDTPYQKTCPDLPSRPDLQGVGPDVHHPA